MQANGNKLHLRFAADGRRTSNKIGTVMAVFNILNEQEHDCDHQYPIALYNGETSKPCIFIQKDRIILFNTSSAHKQKHKPERRVLIGRGCMFRGGGGGAGIQGFTVLYMSNYLYRKGGLFRSEKMSWACV